MSLLVQKISLRKWFLMKLRAANGSGEKHIIKGLLRSVVKDAEKDEKKVYEMYYDYEEPVSKIRSPSCSCIKSWRKRRYSSRKH